MRPKGFPEVRHIVGSFRRLRQRSGKRGSKKRPLCAPETPPSMLESASVAVGKAPPGMIALRWRTKGRVFMVHRCLQISLVARLRWTIQRKENEPPHLFPLRALGELKTRSAKFESWGFPREVERRFFGFAEIAQRFALRDFGQKSDFL